MIIQFITFPLKQCNIVQQHEVEEALRGVDCVYHMASYGMSGREQVWYIQSLRIGCFHMYKQCEIMKASFFKISGIQMRNNSQKIIKFVFQQLNTKLIEAVNIQGTENVIQGN